jgi:diguanylate cyclase (GGDEF)-like protein
MSPDHLSSFVLISGILACSTLVVWMSASALRRLGRASIHPPALDGNAPEGRRPSAAAALPADLDRFVGLVEGLAAAGADAESGQGAPEATRDLAVDLLERLGGSPQEVEALRGLLHREASRPDAPRPPRALVDRLRLLFRPGSSTGRPADGRAAAGAVASDPSAASETVPDGSTENRLLFVSFEQEIRSAERRKAPLTLLDLRIEGFDAFEERFGRAATDRILRGVARAVRSQLRPDDKLVRDAGGAFLAIVPGLAAEGVRALAGRIESAIARHKFALERGRSVAVEASVCAATFPQDGRSYDALLTVVRTRRALAPKGSVVSGPSTGPWRPYPHRIDAPVN